MSHLDSDSSAGPLSHSTASAGSPFGGGGGGGGGVAVIGTVSGTGTGTGGLLTNIRSSGHNVRAICSINNQITS